MEEGCRGSKKLVSKHASPTLRTESEEYDHVSRRGDVRLLRFDVQMLTILERYYTICINVPDYSEKNPSAAHTLSCPAWGNNKSQPMPPKYAQRIGTCAREFVRRGEALQRCLAHVAVRMRGCQILIWGIFRRQRGMRRGWDLPPASTIVDSEVIVIP